MSERTYLQISATGDKQEMSDFSNDFAEWIINHPRWQEWWDDPSPVDLEISETEVKP